MPRTNTVDDNWKCALDLPTGDLGCGIVLTMDPSNGIFHLKERIREQFAVWVRRHLRQRGSPCMPAWPLWDLDKLSKPTIPGFSDMAFRISVLRWKSLPTARFCPQTKKYVSCKHGSEFVLPWKAWEAAMTDFNFPPATEDGFLVLHRGGSHKVAYWPGHFLVTPELVHQYLLRHTCLPQTALLVVQWFAEVDIDSWVEQGWVIRLQSTETVRFMLYNRPQYADIPTDEDRAILRQLYRESIEDDLFLGGDLQATRALDFLRSDLRGSGQGAMHTLFGQGTMGKLEDTNQISRSTNFHGEDCYVLSSTGQHR